MRTNVKHCARCQQDHDGLEFTKLDNAPDEWEWWAMCPAKQQPIWMKVVEDAISENE